MKILHVMPYSPVPPNFGGALRMYNLLRQLTRNHQVTLATFAEIREYGLLRKEFGDQLNGIHFVSHPWIHRHRRLGQIKAALTGQSFFHLVVYRQEMQNLLNWLVTNNTYDVILAEFSHMGGYHLKTDAVRILDAHNVEYDNFRRWWLNARSVLRKFHYLGEYKNFFQEELAVCRQHDAVFVTSDRDKQILDSDVPEVPKFVLPNGVDTSYFTPSDQQPDPHTLVFTGMMGYVPNYDGMLYFLDEIFPLILDKVPEARIFIVGKQPPPILKRRASKNVIITDFVEDVRPFVWKAKVYVVPLRLGGGTRLKVLEAMAMRKPIVTTSIGCEGIHVQDGQSALIRDDPRSFAEAVVDLMQNKNGEEQMIQNGYALVKSRYDWNVIGRQMEAFLEGAVDERNRLRESQGTTAVVTPAGLGGTAERATGNGTPAQSYDTLTGE